MQEHLYKITVQEISSNGEGGKEASFHVHNHDDIFHIIELAKENPNLGADAEPLILGLKLFTEVCMRHRKEEPFASFQSKLVEIVKAIKQQVK